MALNRDHAALLRLALSHEGALRVRIESELAHVLRDYRSAVRGSTNAEDAWLRFLGAIPEHQRRLQRILQATNRKVVADVSEFQLAQAGLGGTPAMRGVAAELRSLADGIAADSSVDIAQTTLATALRAHRFFIDEGAAGRGKSVAHLEERTTGGIGTRRARTIAGTEIHKVANAAINRIVNHAREAGVTVYRVWRSRQDNRVRPSHRAAHGQTVPVGEPFNVGGFLLDYPGDPDGPPEETINCRCYVVLTTRRPRR